MAKGDKNSKNMSPEDLAKHFLDIEGGKKDVAKTVIDYNKILGTISSEQAAAAKEIIDETESDGKRYDDDIKRNLDG